MTQSATMEWTAPDSDYGVVNVTDGPLWAAAIAAGTPVTATQHNSAIASLAIFADMIARPDAAGWRTLVQQLGAGSTNNVLGGAYVSQIYHGPWVASQGKAVPVYGAFPAPAAGTDLTWWKAAAQYMRRLSDWTPGTGTAPSAASAPVLVGFAGAAADAIVPVRGATAPTDLITEDPQARAAAPVLMPAFRDYAVRLVSTALGSPVAVGASEQAAAQTMVALATEYDDETGAGLRQAGYVGAGGLAAAAVAGAMLRNAKFPRRRKRK